jgi:hypothetical protein
MVLGICFGSKFIGGRVDKRKGVAPVPEGNQKPL